MHRTIATLFLSAVICTTTFAAKPNLLLIVADDMGYGDLSCYGSKQIETPHLDRLARGGVRCTDGYVSGPVCAPSRAGLMTGRYGSRFGFEHNLSHPVGLEDAFAGIPLDETLLPQRLQAQGYRTGLVGKWHLGEAVPGHHPRERGFDFFFGMLGGSHAYFPTVDKNRLLINHESPQEIRTPYLTDWFTLEAIDFIQAQGKAKDLSAEQPWFLYLSYNTPHGPMQAKPEDIEQYAHIHDKTRRIYCAMQARMDQNIGQIIASLESSGQLENTLIAFISDNGGSVEVSHAVNAPLKGTKGTFMEGGIRVPTIYHWPARLPGGKVYDQPVIALDVMKTFVTAAGGEAPSAGETEARAGRGKKNLPVYDGVDLVPYFRGESKTPPHETLYWRMALRGSAIREGDWKLLLPNSQFPQLYNLKEDIGETTNLIQDQPEIAARLLAKLNQWEAGLERNPLFMSAPTWSNYNKRLNEKKYSREQPLPDSQEDIWSF
ncbi:sulfatase [Bremerella sp. JC770]|uniref:sulfatase n=1 Tax=Bremerella sp. JC770 TaxID=3232137 RepID=UPI003459D4D0